MIQGLILNYIYLSCCDDYEQFSERLSSRGWLSNNIMEGHQAFVSYV